MSDINMNTDFIHDHIKNFANKQNYKSYDLKIVEEFAKGENYLGEIRRCVLSGVTNNGECETLNLILKTLPPLTRSNVEFPIEKVYENEIYLYNTFLPLLLSLQEKAHLPEDEVRFKIAKCHYLSGEKPKEILIFEDLNKKGFKMCDRMKSLDGDHIMLATKTMASLHALSFAAKSKLTTEEYNEHMDNIFQVNVNKDLEKYIQASVDKIVTFVEVEEDRKRFKKFSEGNIIQEYEKTLNFDRDYKYNIIVHGDFWINNFLFKYEEGKPVDMILLDWQITKLASPIVDLMYLLYVCMDERMRDQYWDQVLDTYYDFFKTRLLALECDPEECFPESVFREELIKYHGFAIINSVIMLPLVLNNKEDSIDLSDILEAGADNYTNVLKYSDTFKERFNGVLRNLIKHNVL